MKYWSNQGLSLCKTGHYIYFDRQNSLSREHFNLVLQFLGHKRTKQKQFVWHKSMGLNRWIERPQIQSSFWIRPNCLDICDTWTIGVIQQSLFFCSIKQFLLWHQNVTRAFVISRNGENSNKVSIQKIINLQFINPRQVFSQSY